MLVSHLLLNVSILHKYALIVKIYTYVGKLLLFFNNFYNFIITSLNVLFLENQSSVRKLYIR